MFEDENGLLTCVQVVRVPLLAGMSSEEAANVLYRIVLAKLVKSQKWIMSTGILPHDFVIFCWSPPVGAFNACLEENEDSVWTEALMFNVQQGGWPFSLEVQVPENPEDMFPANFGLHTEASSQKDLFHELSFFYSGEDSLDDEDGLEWDLFGMDVDFVAVECEEPTDSSNELDDATMSLLAARIQLLEAMAGAQSGGANVHAFYVESCLNNAQNEMRAFLIVEVPEASCVLRYARYRFSSHQREPAQLPRVHGLPWWDPQPPVCKSWQRKRISRGRVPKESGSRDCVRKESGKESCGFKITSARCKGRSCSSFHWRRCF